MIVVDASVALDLVLRRPSAPIIEKRLFSRAETLHAPHLLDLEVAQVLRRYWASGQLSPSRAGEALGDFLDLPLARYQHALLIPRIWQLRNNLTAYDAAYVALAEVLRAPLVTCDRKLAVTPGHRARIELI